MNTEEFKRASNTQVAKVTQNGTVFECSEASKRNPVGKLTNERNTGFSRQVSGRKP